MRMLPVNATTTAKRDPAISRRWSNGFSFKRTKIMLIYFVKRAIRRQQLKRERLHGRTLLPESMPNRKRANARRTDGELLIPPLTEVEGLSISQISPKPVSEVISEDASPEPGTIQDAITDGVVYVVEPPATTAEEKLANEEDVLPVATRKDAEIHTERKVGQHQDGVPSASTAQLHTLPVNELYKHHLLKTIEKMDKEMMYLDRQIRKADLEILLLERQLRE
ncbi:uncharacterized protein LOC124863724 isoform X2 [Girardinichthys multiradiatus]|uniref:uncharacterized protein LOC124863724 isoform X2 n=1 Tax=Girardinichthys multiradiatus TaxID=208333 RepID=UPI001FAE2807|nr:uncharacterized protein LOC124863724 isoform X2 [Girardinichthys multiradiatus]